MAQNNSNTIKDIPGFEGVYAVTSDGRVYSYRRKKFLKPYYNFYGRPTVNLCINYKKKWHFISKLVYETWIGKIPENLQIDHINGDKTDNRHTNLRALTASENMLAYHRIQKFYKI